MTDASHDQPTITAIAHWFGANRLLAHAVGEELAGCRWVGVPFAGGMSELAHIKAPSIVVGDLHRHVINLAKVAADSMLGPQLYRRLRRLAFHPETLRDAQQRCREWEASAWIDGVPCLAWAADYFTAVWMGRSGIAGGRDEFRGGLPVRWNAKGGDSATRYRSAVKSLVAWRRITQRCNFVVEDCFAFLDRVKDDSSCGVYCDPPFPETGDQYRHPFTVSDHVRLAARLTAYRHARVVCRFYDHPMVRELYPEDLWTWRRMVGRKQSNADAPEVLILNGSSLAAPKVLF